MVTGSHKSSIRADSHAFNLTISTVDVCKGLRRPVRHIPNPHRTISRPRDEESPVRRENDRVDRTGVTLEFSTDPPLGNIPNLERQKSFLLSIRLEDDDDNDRQHGSSRTYSDHSLVGRSCKQFAVWAKTYAPKPGSSRSSIDQDTVQK